jgi:hypothetical protein
MLKKTYQISAICAGLARIEAWSGAATSSGCRHRTRRERQNGVNAAIAAAACRAEGAGRDELLPIKSGTAAQPLRKA